MPNVDGFDATVPTANKATFRVHAEVAAAVSREHGAFEVVECWDNDVPNQRV